MRKPHTGMAIVSPRALAATRFAPRPLNAPVSALSRLFQVHPVALCGRFDPLPCRAPFCLRNALHLIEARSRVPHVGGVLQRLLALLWESELAGGYPITSWLG